MFYDQIAKQAIDPSWFMEPYLLNGEVNTITGESGVGKGRFLRNLVARTVMGWPMPPYGINDPTAERNVPQQVIMITPEDNSFDTTIHSLLAEGYDPVKQPRMIKDLTHVVRKNAIGNTARSRFALPQDLNVLRQWIEKMGNVGLVVIDPLLAVATTTISFNQQVRMNIIEPMQELAAETGVCFVVAHHFNKGVNKDLSNLKDRINGSGGITGACRCNNVIVRSPVDRSVRLFLSLKNNMAEEDSITDIAEQDPELMGAGEGEPIAYRITGKGRDTHVEFKQPAPRLDDVERLVSFIVVTLQEAKMPLTDKAIANLCEIPWNLCRQLIAHGIELGVIEKCGKAFAAHMAVESEPEPCPAIEPRMVAPLGWPEPETDPLKIWAAPDKLLW
jgi:hypothetical protein